MNKNIIRNKWTEEHISYLKMAYLHGSPLKQIASKLNRSVSAINKVLARHNLRTHSKMERLPRLLRPTSHQLQQKRNLGASIRKRKVRNLALLIGENRQEVSFERVLFWLKTQNISVTKSANDIYYEVNGRPMNEQQILYQANLLREQLHLPIFWVRGITHS